MKTKRFLSLVIASAMAMQCSVFSVLADNTNSVTVVANDIDTDWKMSLCIMKKNLQLIIRYGLTEM